MAHNNLVCIVLAAGSGTRMVSATPKVMHELAGRPILAHVLATASALASNEIQVVLRHQKEIISEFVKSEYPNVKIVEQDEVAGTGRAVEVGMSSLPATFDGDVLVLSGDVPMLDQETLTELISSHRSSKSAVTVLSAIVDDPSGYGRIIRNADGELSKIVEHLDANQQELDIAEVNSGVYVFSAANLRECLAKLSAHNAQGERYLTDVIALLVAESKKATAQIVADNWLVHGINDRAQLAEVAGELNRRLCRAWQLSGVTILDPNSTWLDVTVQIGKDAVIYPNSHLRGNTKIGTGAMVGPSVVIEDSIVGDFAKVGPFAYLRAGTDLGAEGKIGSFVETKKAKIGRGSKVPHLSYVGDAEIGEFSNIGAGTIFANYDGVSKHTSVIGSNVRTGSNNVFVAPISIGDGAYTAAGTVVRRNIDPGELGMNVAPQRNIADWVLQKRPGTTSAEAAQRSKTK